MEGNSNERSIGQVKGYDLVIKIKNIFERRFKAKGRLKNFLQLPTGNRPEIDKMTRVVFIRLLKEMNLFSPTASQETLLRDVYGLDITHKELEYMVWRIVSEINPYDAVKEGEIDAATLEKFSITPEQLQTLERGSRLGSRVHPYKEMGSLPVQGWIKKHERNQDER